MVKSRGLNDIKLNVSDIQRSRRFYQEAFGLEVTFGKASGWYSSARQASTTQSRSAKSTRVSRLEAAVCRIRLRTHRRASWIMAWSRPTSWWKTAELRRTCARGCIRLFRTTRTATSSNRNSF